MIINIHLLAFSNCLEGGGSHLQHREGGYWFYILLCTMLQYSYFFAAITAGLISEDEEPQT